MNKNSRNKAEKESSEVKKPSQAAFAALLARSITKKKRHTIEIDLKVDSSRARPRSKERDDGAHVCSNTKTTKRTRPTHNKKGKRNYFSIFRNKIRFFLRVTWNRLLLMAHFGVHLFRNMGPWEIFHESFSDNYEIRCVWRCQTIEPRWACEDSNAHPAMEIKDGIKNLLGSLRCPSQLFFLILETIFDHIKIFWVL